MAVITVHFIPVILIHFIALISIHFIALISIYFIALISTHFIPVISIHYVKLHIKPLNSTHHTSLLISSTLAGYSRFNQANSVRDCLRITPVIRTRTELKWSATVS